MAQTYISARGVFAWLLLIKDVPLHVRTVCYLLYKFVVCAYKSVFATVLVSFFSSLTPQSLIIIFDLLNLVPNTCWKLNVEPIPAFLICWMELTVNFITANQWFSLCYNFTVFFILSMASNKREQVVLIFCGMVLGLYGANICKQYSFITRQPPGV